MLINLFEEISWQDFIKRPEIKGKALNEQESYYRQYLQDLDTARQNWNSYQGKGALAQLAQSQVEAPGDPVSCSAGMDVVFLVDFTGSMSAEINAVKSNILTIVNTIIAESGGDYRLGLVLFDEANLPPASQLEFGYALKPAYTSLPAAQRFINENNTIPDPKQQIITAVEVMSDQNLASFQTQLNFINTTDFPLGAGVGGPEPGGIGFEQILEGIAGTFRQNVAKLVILITDAVQGGDDDAYTAGIDNPYLEGLAADALQVNVQALVISQIDYSAGTKYRILAEGTNGLFSHSTSLAPADIISAIEDICVENDN